MSMFIYNGKINHVDDNLNDIVIDNVVIDQKEIAVMFIRWISSKPLLEEKDIRLRVVRWIKGLDQNFKSDCEFEL